MEYIKELKIGNFVLKNNVILAPMVGVTDLPFRRICRKYGVGATISEMVSAKGLIYKDKKTHKIMDMDEDEYPKIVQIFGSDVEVLKQVVEKLNNLDTVDIIDFNMGCPATKVVKNGDGSKLLEDLDKVEEIIKGIMEVSKKPITVKTRLGYTRKEMTAVKVAKMCEKYGVAAITIHGRYKEDYFTGKVDLDGIKLVKEAVSIPVIGNGDIVDSKSAKEMFEYTGVDGIMIGRAVLGAPWIFEEVITDKKREIPNEELHSIIKEQVELACKREREEVAIPKLRKHIAWYLKGKNGANETKNKINMEKEKVKVLEILDEYFNKV